MIRGFSNTINKPIPRVYSLSNVTDVIMIAFINFAETQGAIIQDKEYIRNQVNATI